MGFFESVTTFFEYIGVFFQNLFNSFSFLFDILEFLSIDFVTTVVPVVPSILGSSILVVIAFAVLKLIIGR